MYTNIETKKVLNIGAGFLPLVAFDFSGSGVDEVINYDPLQYQNDTGIITSKVYEEAKEYFRTVLRFKELIALNPEVQYFTKRHEVDSKYGDCEVDLVISISPYGFTLVDHWINEKLKPEGYIVAIGHAGNPYMAEDRLIDTNLRNRYNANSTPESWVQNIINKVCKLYPSNTSRLERDTSLGNVLIYQKTIAIR